MQGLAEVNEVCISATVMEVAGVGDIVKSRPVSRNYENLKGIGQRMEAHRITLRPEADIQIVAYFRPTFGRMRTGSFRKEGLPGGQSAYRRVRLEWTFGNLAASDHTVANLAEGESLT